MFPRQRKPINDNVWVLLDLKRVCEAGGDLYTPQQFIEFFLKIFHLTLRPNSPPPVLELWRVNRKYMLFFKHEQLTAHINLWKKTVYRGESEQNCKTFPLILNEDQMELDLMCIFLVDIVDKQKDDRGRRWSK